MLYIDIYSLFLIALALALDAFGVALSIGLNPSINRNNKIGFCLSFGFFQFLFSYIGAFSGYLFNKYILTIPKIIGGIVIVFVGIFMLKEGKNTSDKNILVNKKMYFILGVSVSIDAAVIGFTVLSSIKNNFVLFQSAFFIGIITLIMCIIAFIISKYLRKIQIISKYSDYTAGIMLILFGLKMIFL